MQFEKLKFSRLVYFFLFSLCLSFQTLAQDFQKVHEGVEYAQFKRTVKTVENKDAPVVINVLRLDLKRARLDVVHAMDAAIGVERTSSIAARYNAVAAINGGFFRIKDDIFKGDAVGALIVDNAPFSEPFPGRIALFINNDHGETSIDFNHFELYHSVVLGKNRLPVSGFNRQRGDNELVIFNPSFHTTTLTNSNGIEIVVNSRNRIVRILNNRGSTAIPRNGFVISASGDFKEKLRRTVRVGGYVRAGIRFGEPKAEIRELYETSEDILGGNPQLIKNGKIEITWREEKAGEKFVIDRHPRTAVAKLKDGRALLVTVDGRQEGVSAGMNLQEVAEMLLEMGAVDAMNLDGGGSTTMFYNGKIVNRPSDKEGERPVSDAILVTLRK